MNLSNSVLVSVALCFSTAAFSADNPVYVHQDGVLTLPSVDISDQVGKYQDVIFQLTPQGSWILTAVQEFGSGKLAQAAVGEVEVIKTGTLPVSVYLRARGWLWTCGFSGGLSGPGRIHQRLKGMQFDVGITIPFTDEYTKWELCAAPVLVFKMTVPLQVYGLRAGTYSYNVNGITGTFTLESDNKFPDDCDVASDTPC